MPFDKIKKAARNNSLKYREHAEEKMYNLSLSNIDVIDIILNGKIRKRETDDLIDDCTKFTVIKGKRGVVVKDSEPVWVITIFKTN
jgi:hypothetical protein